MPTATPNCWEETLCHMTWWWWNWSCRPPLGSSPGSASQRCRASWRGCQAGGLEWWPSPGCSWSSYKALGRGTWCPRPPRTFCWTGPAPARGACWPGRCGTAWTPDTLRTEEDTLASFTFFTHFTQKISKSDTVSGLTRESRSFGHGGAVLRYWCCFLSFQLFETKHWPLFVFKRLYQRSRRALLQQPSTLGARLEGFPTNSVPIKWGRSHGSKESSRNWKKSYFFK